MGGLPVPAGSSELPVFLQGVDASPLAHSGVAPPPGHLNHLERTAETCCRRAQL